MNRYLSSGKASEDFKDEAAVSDLLMSALQASIAKNLKSGSGVLFSGGVDSALIAYLSVQQMPDTKLFTVGLKGSADITRGSEAAAELGLADNLHIRIISISELETVIPKVMNVLGIADPMSISLGIPLYFACCEARARGITVLLTGQGADELFGGYHRYTEIIKSGTQALHEAIAADVKNLPERDIKRDSAVSEAAGIKLIAPYLDREVVEIGLSIPADLKVKKINGEVKGKYILRRTAAGVIPGTIAWRDKKAMQYGSGVWAALGKLARQSGYKKQDKGYIRKYLYSVAEENRINLDVIS